MSTRAVPFDLPDELFDLDLVLPLRALLERDPVDWFRELLAEPFVRLCGFRERCEGVEARVFV